jgi:3-hydroxybutyryl-CoA dehydrogenase
MHISDIKTIGIVGAGTMGAGIAEVFAESGYSVIWYNRSVSGMARGLGQIRKNRSTLIQNGVLTSAEAEAADARLHPTHDLADLTVADVISESIAEDLETKRDLFRKLDGLCLPDAILTTNTSGLSISQIAEAVSHPARFAGMHYVNPAHIVPLVEIIKGDKTADATCALLLELAGRIRKHPVLVKKDVPGFIANRIQFAVIREALHIIEAGIAEPADIDVMMKSGLGLRWALLGPLETADLGGLDLFNTIAGYMFPALSDSTDAPKGLQTLVDAGKLGAKSGAGFYDYSERSAQQRISERDEKLLKLLEIKNL